MHPKYGYLTSCPSNLGTGLRGFYIKYIFIMWLILKNYIIFKINIASVHVHLPGWVKEGVDKLKKRCNELGKKLNKKFKYI